jgi:hypothetical protein
VGKVELPAACLPDGPYHEARAVESGAVAHRMPRRRSPCPRGRGVPRALCAAATMPAPSAEAGGLTYEAARPRTSATYADTSGAAGIPPAASTAAGPALTARIPGTTTAGPWTPTSSQPAHSAVDAPRHPRSVNNDTSNLAGDAQRQCHVNQVDSLWRGRREKRAALDESSTFCSPTACIEVWRRLLEARHKRRTKRCSSRPGECACNVAVAIQLGQPMVTHHHWMP